jgi:hypothetical protein
MTRLYMRRVGVWVLALVLACATPIHAAGAPVVLLDEALAAAVTGTTPDGVVIPRLQRVESLTLQAVITVVGGGTTAKAWVQTSLDGGVTWVDIASFAFTTSTATRVYHLTPVAVTTIATPTDGTLTDNTAVNGILGDRFRVKLTTTGTYTGASSFVIHATVK